MAFRVGQKVVCVDDDPRSYRAPDDPAPIGLIQVERGSTYIIRWAGPAALWRAKYNWHGPSSYCVRVEGIFRGGTNGNDTPFDAGRFRPLVEKKTETGMAVLQEILERETINDDVPVKA